MENQIKIIFFGTSDFAVPALEYLIQNGYNITGVVTQPEKPIGRAKIVMPSPVKKFAQANNIPIFEPHNLKTDEEFFKNFKHLNSDLCIVAAYGKIIPGQFLDIPGYGFLNIHPSLLPKYRGPSPIQTAIANGDKETGVAVIKIDEKTDHGPLLGYVGYKLKDDNYYKDTEKELANLGGELLLEILPKYIKGEIELKEQNHSLATFTKLLAREDGIIDWNRPAEETYNQIRALNIEPGTWTRLRLKSFGGQSKILNIKTAGLLPDDNVEDNKPGTILSINNLIVVATKKCYLILKRIQLEGGKEMDASAFLNGHPDFLGSVLGKIES